MKKNRTFIFIYLLLSILISLTAVLLIFLYDAFDNLGKYVGYKRLSAFTNISNITVLVFLVMEFIYFIRKIKHDESYKYFFIVTSNMILLTFIVFGLILTPGYYILNYRMANFYPFDVRSLFCHFIVPIIFIINVFYVNPLHEKIKFSDAFFGLIPSAAYYVLTMIIGQFINPIWFPYPFMDFTLFGFFFEGKYHFGIIPMLVILLGLAFGLSMLIRHLSNKASFRKRKKAMKKIT